MKTNNRELCHIWAQQSQATGKGSNIFFERESIYSYGYHFEIARFINPETILFTARNYSVTTSKHKSYVLRAISHKTVFVVPSFTDHAENISYYKLQIKNSLFDAVNAKKYSEQHLQSAENLVTALIDYCQKFDIELDQECKELLEKKYNKSLLTKEQRTKIKNQEIERIKKEQLRKKEDIQKWLNFEKQSITLSNQILLRAKNDIIETTLGAKVPIKEGERLYEALRIGINPVNYPIGHYYVNSFDGKYLKIGCHNLEMVEIERFAALQGWN